MHILQLLLKCTGKYAALQSIINETVINYRLFERQYCFDKWMSPSYNILKNGIEGLKATAIIGPRSIIAFSVLDNHVNCPISVESVQFKGSGTRNCIAFS